MPPDRAALVRPDRRRVRRRDRHRAAVARDRRRRPSKSARRPTACGVDLGGIGKGYAVDLMAELLEEWGLDRAFVHGGFSSAVALEPPAGCDGWPLTLSDPRRAVAGLRRLSMRQAALSASGVRKGDHILDPRTGAPVRGRLAAWVAFPRPARPATVRGAGRAQARARRGRGRVDDGVHAAARRGDRGLVRAQSGPRGVGPSRRRIAADCTQRHRRWPTSEVREARIEARVYSAGTHDTGRRLMADEDDKEKAKTPAAAGGATEAGSARPADGAVHGARARALRLRLEPAAAVPSRRRGSGRRDARRRRGPAGDQRRAARRRRPGPGADGGDAPHSRACASARCATSGPSTTSGASSTPSSGSSRSRTATRTTARCSTRRSSSTR